MFYALAYISYTYMYYLFITTLNHFITFQLFVDTVFKFSSPRISPETMDLTRYFSIRMNSRRHQTNQDSGGHEDQIKKSLPLLASPINENAREALSQHSSDLERAIAHKSTDGSLAITSFTGSGRSSGNLIIYKEHHEASTIELFYDLYFVANLGNLS
jgi:hypothetical protein